MRRQPTILVLVTATAFLTLAAATLLIVSERLAARFDLFLYLLANLFFLVDFLDLMARLYSIRVHSWSAMGGGRIEMSIAPASTPLTPDQRRRLLRPFAILVSIRNLGVEAPDFIEKMEPWRDLLWIVDDDSTDQTPSLLEARGFRCVRLTRNRRKPGAIKVLLARLPAEIETVLVIDPDIRFGESATAARRRLEESLFDLQRSSMAAFCPRIEIRPGSLLTALQSLEYSIAFHLGRRSLGATSITSGIAAYRRRELEWALDRHSLSVYAEDLENSLLLLGGGRGVYYDGRVAIETDGAVTWRGWFSQRVGWAYGLVHAFWAARASLLRIVGRDSVAFYQYLVYMGVLMLAIQPLRVAALVLLSLSLGRAAADLSGVAIQAWWAPAEPAYLLTAYLQYTLLAAFAWALAAPRGLRLKLSAVVPFYFFYAVAQTVPMTIGYLNLLSLKAFSRRIYRDHYQDEESLAVAADAVQTAEHGT